MTEEDSRTAVFPVKRVQKYLIIEYKKINFHKRLAFYKKEMSMQTFIVEVRPAALLNYVFQNEYTVTILAICRFFGHQASFLKTTKLSTSLKQSIKTLKEKFKAVVFENDELIYRDMSLLISDFYRGY